MFYVQRLNEAEHCSLMPKVFSCTRLVSTQTKMLTPTRPTPTAAPSLVAAPVHLGSRSFYAPRRGGEQYKIELTGKSEDATASGEWDNTPNTFQLRSRNPFRETLLRQRPANANDPCL